MIETQATARTGESIVATPGLTYAIRRTKSGVKAETEIPIPECGKYRRLTISTSKGSRGITAFASVANVKDGIVSFVIYGDFSKTLARSNERATEKTIRRIHEGALAQVPALLAEARAFYEVNGAKLDRLTA